MKNNACFSSMSNEWRTPIPIFNSLDRFFHFDLDPASTDLNCLCSRHFTISDDGLSQSWEGATVFCNPPYGRSLHKWVEKAFFETRGKDGARLVVLLIPARTDTSYFHEFILGRAEVRFISGRLRFVGSSCNAPFPSMLVIFRNMHYYDLDFINDRNKLLLGLSFDVLHNRRFWE